MRATAIIAIVLLAMLFTNAVVVESGVAVIVIAIVVSGVIGGLIGYHIGRQQADTVVAFEAYRNRTITVTTYVNQVSSIMAREFSAYVNNSLTLNATYFPHFTTYYRQWADYIACSSCSPGAPIPSPNTTLTPIAEDLANMVKSEIDGVLQLLNERVKTAVNLIELLKIENVGRASGSLTIVYQDMSAGSTYSYYNVSITQNPQLWVGEVVVSNVPTLMFCAGTQCSARPYELRLGNAVIGYYYWWNGTYEINYTAIVAYVMSESPSTLSLRPATAANVASASFTLGLVDAAPRLYRTARMQYQTYCQGIQNLPQSPVCYPPPSVVIPVEDALRLPPEVQLQIFVAYLNQLATANWTQVREVTPQTVYIAVGAAKIYGVLNGTLVEVSPVAVPFGLLVKVGRPLPLIGTWIVNGTLRTYTALTVSSDMTFTRVADDVPYFYVYASGGTLLGLGVDIDGNSSPDVYTAHYLSNVTRILDYDTSTWQYVEKTETTIGMYAKEYKPLQGVTDYPAGLPLPELLQVRVDSKTLIIAAAALAFIVLIAVAAAGRKPHVVVVQR